MIRAFGPDDGGQSIVLVAGGFAMLLAAVALSIDWGYSFAQRRTMTNAAQEAALAAGRLVASGVIMSSGSPRLSTYQEDVYGEACSWVRQNMGGAISGGTYEMTVEFYTAGGTTSLGSISRTITSACPAFSTPFTAMDQTTRDIRIVTTVTYPSLFGEVAGKSSISAGGVARSRIVGGASIFNGGTPWPIVAHYDLTSLNSSTCGSPCNPTTATPVTLWSTSENYGSSWKGGVDFSRCSGKQNSATPSPCAAQLITVWDQSGSPAGSPATTAKPTISPSMTATTCSGNTFDTEGPVPGSNAQAKGCGLANWVYYGFHGTLSLCTKWNSTQPAPPTSCPTNAPTPTAHASHSPSPLSTSRTSCTGLPSYLVAPSCTSGGVGDWVETITGDPAVGVLKSAIGAFGESNEFSNVAIPGGGGTVYGKALAVNAYLWDCAEEFKQGAWTLVTPKPTPVLDCSSVTTANWPNGRTADRIHLFTVAPFTFYEGLIDVTSGYIKGFWGGGFASPDSCPANGSCSALNTSNTTILVDPQ